MTDGPPTEPGAELDPGVDVEAVEAELDDVARALDRLDDGSYGTCEVCGSALPDDALAASPAARWCPDHQPSR